MTSIPTNAATSGGPQEYQIGSHAASAVAHDRVVRLSTFFASSPLISHTSSKGNNTLALTLSLHVRSGFVVVVAPSSLADRDLVEAKRLSGDAPDYGRRDSLIGSYPLRNDGLAAPSAWVIRFTGRRCVGNMASRAVTSPNTVLMRSVVSTPLQSRSQPHWPVLCRGCHSYPAEYEGNVAFDSWGWRIPLSFRSSSRHSLYIRLRMKESPIFQYLKSAGMTSAKPLKEAFTKWKNLRLVLISLFGATAGQGVVWYTGQFYALFYLQTVLNVNGTSATYIIAIALLLGMPFFVVFGALSDRIGRKRIIMLGCLLAAVFYIPIYRAMQSAAGSNVVTASGRPNQETGAISLTPLTYVDGVLQPAKQVLPYTDFASLISSPIAWS